jgi:hypothetical protein
MSVKANAKGVDRPRIKVASLVCGSAMDNTMSAIVAALWPARIARSPEGY